MSSHKVTSKNLERIDSGFGELNVHDTGAERTMSTEPCTQMNPEKEVTGGIDKHAPLESLEAQLEELDRERRAVSKAVEKAKSKRNRFRKNAAKDGYIFEWMEGKTQHRTEKAPEEYLVADYRLKCHAYGLARMDLRRHFLKSYIKMQKPRKVVNETYGWRR